MNLIEYINNHIEWSKETFGPGGRTSGIIDHITKEIKEIEDNPKDIYEWIDVIILSLDGASREGFTAEEICAALQAKLEKNKSRQWPDWRSAETGKAIEHIRE